MCIQMCVTYKYVDEYISLACKYLGLSLTTAVCT